MQEESNRLLRKLKNLEEERSSWDSHWEQLASLFLPRRSRFLNAGAETNKGGAINKLEDGTGILALKTLSSGMQSGLTSPARPWFSLALVDSDLTESQEAKAWLHDTYEKIVAVFAKSNFYDQIHVLYQDLGCFGTGAMIVEEDSVNVIRCRTLAVGQYSLDTNATGRVDTVYMRKRMTPRQIEETWPDCPQSVKDMAKNEQFKWLTVLQAVEPNKKKRSGSRDSKERPFKSTYMLIDGGKEILEDSGFYEFPVLCPRWVVTGSDVYGASPAMDSMGDCLQLQQITKDTRIALEKEVNPPLLINTTFPGGVINTSPGGVNVQNGLAQGQNSIVPLYQVRANLQGAENTRAQLKDQIQKHFHNDLFMMLTGVNRQMTATEVAERNAEKMLQLGPVLDRLRSELFQPLVERVFGIMDRFGMLAIPPEALRQKEIKIEFISILAQAQKQAGIGSISQTMSFVAQMAQMNPEIIDKVNFDEALDEWAEMQGVPPKLIRSDEEVAELRQARADQQQQQQQMMMMAQGAEIAKTGAGAMKDLNMGVGGVSE